MSSQKLYVLVRKDLSKSQQAVQAGHAVAEYLLHGPITKWENGTLIYLGVNNEQELVDWKMQLNNYIEFREPDIGNQITAIATEENKFSGMRLL